MQHPSVIIYHIQQKTLNLTNQFMTERRIVKISAGDHPRTVTRVRVDFELRVDFSYPGWWK